MNAYVAHVSPFFYSGGFFDTVHLRIDRVVARRDVDDDDASANVRMNDALNDAAQCYDGEKRAYDDGCNDDDDVDDEDEDMNDDEQSARDRREIAYVDAARQQLHATRIAAKKAKADAVAAAAAAAAVERGDATDVDNDDDEDAKPSRPKRGVRKSNGSGGGNDDDSRSGEPDRGRHWDVDDDGDDAAAREVWQIAARSEYLVKWQGYAVQRFLFFLFVVV
jgi:hypothetical protein